MSAAVWALIQACVSCSRAANCTRHSAFHQRQARVSSWQNPSHVPVTLSLACPQWCARRAPCQSFLPSCASLDICREKHSCALPLSCSPCDALVAQVHRAVLQFRGEPRQVVVKVRHPGVATSIAVDFRLLKPVAAAASAIPSLKGLSLKESLAQFSANMTAQVRPVAVSCQGAPRPWIQIPRNLRTLHAVGFRLLKPAAAAASAIPSLKGLSLKESLAQFSANMTAQVRPVAVSCQGAPRPWIQIPRNLRTLHAVGFRLLKPAAAAASAIPSLKGLSLKESLAQFSANMTAQVRPVAVSCQGAPRPWIQIPRNLRTLHAVGFCLLKPAAAAASAIPSLKGLGLKESLAQFSANMTAQVWGVLHGRLLLVISLPPGRHGTCPSHIMPQLPFSVIVKKRRRRWCCECGSMSVVSWPRQVLVTVLG